MIRGAERNRDANEREKGFQAALAEAGVSCDDCVEPGDFTEASGYRAAQALVLEAKRPTAIFAANDSMAVGALSAVREAGLRIPEDVAVVGFDDVPIAEYVNPALTTVRVSIASLGAKAAERLLTSMSNNSSTERKHEVLPTELVIRSSCGGRQPNSSTGAMV